MPPYEKHLIEETSKMVTENNKMLRSMQRAARLGQLWSFLKWVFIIALTVGSYYYLQPYLEPILKLYGSLGGAADLKAVGEGLQMLQGQ